VATSEPEAGHGVAVVHTVAPGRVNLIGDHTDYNQGLALPMAIGLGVSVRFEPSATGVLVITSDAYPGERASVPVDVDASEVRTREPGWVRLVAAVVSLARPGSGGSLHLSSDLPRGAGLSSSAAVAVALADAFGVEGDPLVLARLCQAAEHRTGVPVGLLDPLACAAGTAGHALLIDFATLDVRQVPVPGDAEFTVIDSGRRRDLRDSAYGARVLECEAAAAVIGPLGLATGADITGLRDPVLRRRARHVRNECLRVRQFAEALRDGDLVAAGLAMDESHSSLADEFEASTPGVDALVTEVRSRPGVLGVRMTGAGFGGCVVALGEPGSLTPEAFPTPAWRVTPSDGALARHGVG
jgi:galactokinase